VNLETRLWFALIGLLMILPIWFFARIARRQGSDFLLKEGLLVEAEVLECRQDEPGHRFRFTYITYRFLPTGRKEPITVTKRLETLVGLPLGTKVAVRYMRGYPSISLLVPYAKFHDPA
jgi:hypothetical protein